jgi:hypothetical protein
MASLRLMRGKVYRTEDLSPFDKNPTRLASKLVRAGKLRRLRMGLYHAPFLSAFGEVPPSEDELLRAYFRGRRYLRTGPSVWNALGLGTTGVEAVPLVYNTTRTENAVRAGVELESVRRGGFLRNRTRSIRGRPLALTAALEAGRFDSDRLALGQRGTRAGRRSRPLLRGYLVLRLGAHARGEELGGSEWREAGHRRQKPLGAGALRRLQRAGMRRAGPPAGAEV